MPLINELVKLDIQDYAIVQTNPNFREFFKSLGFTKQWVDGEISNFSYLMYLNIFNCRSFNDPSTYPIFPWTISDFDSEELLSNWCNRKREIE